VPLLYPLLHRLPHPLLASASQQSLLQSSLLAPRRARLRSPPLSQQL